MKNLLTTLVLLVSVVNAFGLPGAVDTGRTDNIHLYLVIDCGRMDMASWNMIRARTIEAICALKAGDQITVITAYPSGPRSNLDSIITQDKNATESDIKKIATLNKDWVLRAQVSTAMALAYESLTRADVGRHCCMVLSPGDMGDEELGRVKHVAELFTIRKSPVTLICGHSRLNRKLLMGDIELHFLDKPAIGQWLSKVRPVITVPQGPKPTPTPRPYMVKPPVVPPPVKSPPKSDGNTVVVINPKPIPDDSNSKTPVFTPPPGPDPNNSQKPQPRTTPVKIPDANMVDINDTCDTRPHTTKFWQGSMIKYVIATIVALGMVAFLVISTANYRNAKAPVTEASQDTISDEFNIVAIHADQRYELRAEVSIKTLVFGTSPQSAVPLTGDGIDADEFRLIKKKNEFTVKNTSSHDLTVNGMPLKSKKVLAVTFPMSIISEQGLTLVIARESSNQNI